MPAIEQISRSNALIFKDVRLRALQDSPTAFGSTYARESQLSDSDWLKRAADWSSNRSVGYLAMDDGAPCGIVAAFLNETDPFKAHLVSMWVAPTHRRVGVGRTLVTAVQSWAITRGARLLQLTVTSSNRAAIEFYVQNGFSMTGNTEPYSNDPTLIEYEMSRTITAM